jgi:putative (di)nucleoside polyphosphate hydrolase
MGDVIDSDGYRANVGIVLMRGGGETFLGHQVGGRGWQFPQGGVQGDESPEEAVYRELHEEVGLRRDEVALVAQSTGWLRYRLPPKYVRRNRFPMCIGQKQRWFLFRLQDENAKFDFASTPTPEFDDYRWVNYWDPVQEVIFFKRGVYVQALQELAPHAFPNGAPPLPSWWQEATARAPQPLPASAAID